MRWSDYWYLLMQISRIIYLFLKRLKESIKKRIPGILITMVTRFSEETVLINRYWISSIDKPDIQVEFLTRIEPVVNVMLSEKNPSDYREMT